MNSCNCDKPKNSKWNNVPVCRSCYKKFWAQANGKTNTAIKYKKEYDQYVPIIKEMASYASISDIEKETSLYYKIIISICKKHNIEIQRKGLALKTKDRELKFLELLKAGYTISAARKQVNFNPKKANRLAATASVYPKTKDERAVVSHEDLKKRTCNHIEIVKEFRKHNRRVFEVFCKKCKNTSIKEICYLDRDCTHCTVPTKTQNNIANWIESLSFDVKQNTKLSSNKQIDIYVPSAKLGIEYCGLYWHTDNRINKSQHYDKMKEANSEGVRLITIFEDEWLNREAQVKNFLLSTLGKNEIKIYGRKTTVRSISKQTANTFYDENHIQGKPKNTFFDIGIFSQNNILLGCMSFGPHHRGNKVQTAVLNRLAFLHNHTIYGGASKLLVYAIEHLKTQGYLKIVSWSDNRWSEGDVYGKLGFFLEEELKSDYSYVKDKKRTSKQSLQKKQLIKMGAIGNTESEMAKSLDYLRIWDCGKKRWVLNIV